MVGVLFKAGGDFQPKMPASDQKVKSSSAVGSRDAYLKFGLASQRSQPRLTKRFHRHNEVELDFVEKGRFTFLFGNGQATFTEGQFFAFWGAMPHQLIEFEKGSIIHWLTVPLAWCLQWALPDRLVRRLLSGDVVVEGDPERVPSDQSLFEEWHTGLNAGTPELQKLVLLEAEVRLRRLALSAVKARNGDGPSRKKKHTIVVPGTGPGKVDLMAQFIAQRYTHPICVADIAGEVGLHPDYAVTLFRKTCGMSLVEYITQHRVSHAQRLLATTDMNILDVAFASGFGSASRFYVVFEKHSGHSPRAFRHAMKRGLQ